MQVRNRLGACAGRVEGSGLYWRSRCMYRARSGTPHKKEVRHADAMVVDGRGGGVAVELWRLRGEYNATKVLNAFAGYVKN